MRDLIYEMGRMVTNVNAYENIQSVASCLKNVSPACDIWNANCFRDFHFTIENENLSTSMNFHISRKIYFCGEPFVCRTILLKRKINSNLFIQRLNENLTSRSIERRKKKILRLLRTNEILVLRHLRGQALFLKLIDGHTIRVKWVTLAQQTMKQRYV